MSPRLRLSDGRREGTAAWEERRPHADRRLRSRPRSRKARAERRLPNPISHTPGARFSGSVTTQVLVAITLTAIPTDAKSYVQCATATGCRTQPWDAGYAGTSRNSWKAMPAARYERDEEREQRRAERE